MSDDWRGSYDSWKLRSPYDEDPERPDVDPEDCPYCEQAEQKLNQEIDINEALRGALHDAVKALKALRSVVALSGIEKEIALADAAITDAEIILGEPANPK